MTSTMATMLNKQILISSLNKAIDESKVDGKLDLRIIHLYSLYMYYIDFTDGKEEFISVNKHLKEMLSELKYKFPTILCNYKLLISNTKQPARSENTAPTVDDKVIDLDGRMVYSLTVADFTNNYFDAEGDPYNTVIIYPSSTFNNTNKLYHARLSDETLNPIIRLYPVTSAIEIPVEEVTSLSYMQDAPNNPTEINAVNKEEVNFNFKFRISDESIFGSLYSDLATISFTNSKYLPNLPATIGDITITVDNRAITTLTLAMFTTMLQPPYSDPENDLIDAIRIDSISSSNEGVFYFDNNPVQPGKIITRSEINNGLLTHVGANKDTIAGDSMEFSARDEGSMIWVN